MGIFASMIKPPEHLNQQQFGLNEGHYTPTFSSPHVAPGATAYGTPPGHPGHQIDKALGRSYRARSLASLAKGETASTSDILHATSALMNVGNEGAG